ncbi:hypothetical protein L873DRAFT_1786058 [Choiromyces venosus 120613-1]|uniref:Uncharacterized protein n=1 Tax=Choiromyces venosus 120613-1 TaxID=1336337 RepID=A0A3N4K691_9PEZI|nr:hypothetical protein L873DRAFT_1786058 [Choiromyces venosus 120613-1]
MLTRSQYPGLGRSSVRSLPYFIIRASSTTTESSSSSPENSETSGPADTPPTTTTTPNNGTKKPYIPRDNLPVSPIEDPKKYVKYSKAHPKAPKPLKNAPLPELEKRLTLNPYAHMLVQPVRLEVEYYRRVPRAWLIRFKHLVHPETRETWVVPHGLRQTDSDRNRVKRGYWVMGNMNMLREFNKKGWKKIAADIMNEKPVFPEGVAESVRDLMRKRVFDEVFDVQQRSGDKCFVEGGEIEEVAGSGFVEIGCVLDWELEEGTAGVIVDTGEVDVNSGVVERKEILVRIHGRLCPVHHMRVMLGEEVAGKIRELWGLGEGVTKVGLVRREGTLKLEIWLMKLRAYMGIW